jgi:hypothetical protein
VNAGPKDIHYNMALEALSELKYEPIIPEIIKLADTNLGNDLRPQDDALRMMRNLESEEFIESLKKMKETGKVPSIRNDAAEILEKIEARHKSSNVGQNPGK